MFRSNQKRYSNAIPLGDYSKQALTSKKANKSACKALDLKNHLGNVLVAVSDRVLPQTDDGVTVSRFEPEILSAVDYYPFGMEMPGRKLNSSDSRYGFNGQEGDDEIYGSKNLYVYKHRMSDARLGGQFWSIDPLFRSYPGWSPFHFAQRTPVWARELEGLEAWYTTTESGDQEIIEGASGPLSNAYAEGIGATHYGVTEDQPDYSFSDQEVQDFSNWNATNGPTEPGACLGCATTGSEMLTGADGGFRNSSGNNVLNGKTLYDLGRNLEGEGNAAELPTSQGQETTTIIKNPNAEGTANTAYLGGPAGAYHSILIIHNSSNNTFSIFDQGTGWDVKNETQQGAQSQIDDINSYHPDWGSRIWQIYKTQQTEVLYPLGN